jgi:hypothetical protein
VKRRGSPTSHVLALCPRPTVSSQRAAHAHAAENLWDTDRPTIPATVDIDITRHLRISMKIDSVTIPEKVKRYAIRCRVWKYGFNIPGIAAAFCETEFVSCDLFST